VSEPGTVPSAGDFDDWYEEGVSSLPMLDLTRRVMASSTAP
jgi:hypothetical protein